MRLKIAGSARLSRRDCIARFSQKNLYLKATNTAESPTRVSDRHDAAWRKVIENLDNELDRKMRKGIFMGRRCPTLRAPEHRLSFDRHCKRDISFQWRKKILGVKILLLSHENL